MLLIAFGALLLLLLLLLLFSLLGLRTAFFPILVETVRGVSALFDCDDDDDGNDVRRSAKMEESPKKWELMNAKIPLFPLRFGRTLLD